MRWSCSTQCFASAFQQGQMTINTFLDTLTMLGWGGVEIAAEHLPLLSSGYASVLSQQLRDHTLTLSALSCSVPSPQETVAALERYLQFAKESQARLLCLTGIDRWEPYRAGLTEVANEAERLSLPLAVVLPLREGIGREVNELLDAVGSPYLNICVALTTEVSPLSSLWEDWQMVAPFVCHVHLKVTNLASALTWLPFLEPLREVEYDGFLSLQQVPEPVEESLLALQQQLISAV